MHPFLSRHIALLGLGSACLGLGVETRATAVEPPRVRVLSYNIHHGEGVDGKVDLGRIADVITSAKPDIVALQEVDRETRRTGRVDQPAELARRTGMRAIFGGNIPYEGGNYGNAMLSRLPIKLIRNHPLRSFYEGEQRGMMEAEVELPGLDSPILFFATHLDYRGGSRERPASSLQINARIAQSPDRPALLAGDLNDRAGSETLNNFEILWARTGAEELPTYPSEKPIRQIDFILLHPRNRWKVIESRVLEEAVASDHRAFFAVLEWQLRP